MSPTKPLTAFNHRNQLTRGSNRLRVLVTETVHQCLMLVDGWRQQIQTLATAQLPHAIPLAPASYRRR